MIDLIMEISLVAKSFHFHGKAFLGFIELVFEASTAAEGYDFVGTGHINYKGFAVRRYISL